MMPQSFWQYDILISIAITAIGFKSHIIQLNIGYDASVLFTTSHFDYWKQSILLHLNPMSSNSTSSLKSNIGVATPDTMVFRLTTTTIYPVINCFKVNIQSIDDLKKNITYRHLSYNEFCNYKEMRKCKLIWNRCNVLPIHWILQWW